MTTELNGPGNIAGESVGGTGANLNERPDNSTPGGGNNGNAGNHDSNSASSSAADKQIAAVKNDPKVRQKLADLIKSAKAINPNAHLSITKLSQTGEMTVQIDGLTVDQTSAIGLGGISRRAPNLKNRIPGEPVRTGGSLDIENYCTVSLFFEQA
jgi:hypothetical protein